ncbi:hypothetical protein IGI04_024648 [Brassica rapa subsp. trilocularis]|uniref:Nitrile-specifier protein 5 n=1 Tax=Brassica rapa subsp. trilocularis TaxID=1813537 RepID=A0ABQ7M8K5_BRACM|nr:hypothetical protein IGI04_024648 [Brassica rapa subsp. trilocularis]
MSPVADNKWVKVGQKGAGPGPRSSHAITVVGNKVYCFGGELKPTIHIDNDLYVFDLDTQEWSIAPATGDAPFPCFGVSMVPIGTTIYVYGGRDDSRNTTACTLTTRWRTSGSCCLPSRKGFPVGATTLWPATTGKFTSLVALRPRGWVEYPAAGEACKGRGAPGLVVVDGKVWVLFGFDGNELGDIHCFDLVSGQWTAVETTGDVPPARSVFPAVSSGKYIVIYGGEEEPHELMHMGAGKLSGDIYRFDTETLVWEKVVDGTEEGKNPCPRGWCAFAVAVVNGEKGLLVHGGNSPTNERLDDMLLKCLEVKEVFST